MRIESLLVPVKSSRSHRRRFLEEVLLGLRRVPKCLPCKYFYDEVGSRLFDKMGEQPEYYLARTELEIMRKNVHDIARQLGSGVLLIEYGNRSNARTCLLLDHLPLLSLYVPVDLSREHLERNAALLIRQYPHIEIVPVCADFNNSLSIPVPSQRPLRNVVYFPGSTIGNFERDEALVILERIAHVCGSEGGLLIGIDLKKSPAVIEAAYNDAQGVTAEFNLNLLRRINRELLANFHIDRFCHHAIYDPQQGRIEISLMSRCRQSVTIADSVFLLERGEMIRTAYSHKYTIESFGELANRAGFVLEKAWTDSERRFAVLYFITDTSLLK